MKNQIIYCLALAAILTSGAARSQNVDLNYEAYKDDGGYSDPTRANGEGYFQWPNCWDRGFDDQPIGPSGTLKGTSIIPQCRPDTLYSWGDSRKLSEFEKLAGDKGPWAPSFHIEVFSTLNPVATFGYGAIPLRLKLKQGLRFYFFDATKYNFQGTSYCNSLIAKKDQPNTVVVRAWNNAGTTGVDYILCSPENLESWSHDTVTHYDEILASLRWNRDHVSNNQPNNWIPYIYVNGSSELFDDGLDGGLHNGVSWSRRTLAIRLNNMHANIVKNLGEVFYNPAVPAAKDDVQRHFATSKPIYWNPGHPHAEVHIGDAEKPPVVVAPAVVPPVGVPAAAIPQPADQPAAAIPPPGAPVAAAPQPVVQPAVVPPAATVPQLGGPAAEAPQNAAQPVAGVPPVGAPAAAIPPAGAPPAAAVPPAVVPAAAAPQAVAAPAH